jgi:glutamate synthase (NADPH/NADH) large chain
MSLKTRFGNLKNVLDEDSSQTEILVLDSPFVANAQFDEMVSHFGDSVVRSTAPSPWTDDALREGLERIRSEAEDAVRSGAGHIILTDQGQGETACADADDPRHQRGAFAG